MVEPLDPDNFHIVQTTEQRYRISDLDPMVRRKALSSIHDVLGVKTFRQRLMVTRQIIKALSGYHHEKSLILDQRTKERQDWFNGIAKHAEALADLAVAYPDDFSGSFIGFGEDQLEQLENTVNMLYGWADLGRHYGASPTPQKPGRRRDMKMIILIDRLRHIYQALTGDEPKRSINTTSQTPTGPFFRMMRGVCDLGGIAKTDGAIDTAIRQWQKRFKHLPNFNV